MRIFSYILPPKASLLPVSAFTHVRIGMHRTCFTHAPRVPTCPPKESSVKYSSRVLNKALTHTIAGETEMEYTFTDAEKNIRAEFLKVLRSRRSAEGEIQTNFHL